MAKTIQTASDGRKYIVVAKNDTLSEIALDSNVKSASGNATWQQLAAINNIKNPNLIYVNQKIYLTRSSSGSGSSGTSNTSGPNKAIVTHFGLQNNTDKTLFATWEWSKASQTEEYRVRWRYGTGDGIAFVGLDTTTTERQHTYNIPDAASTRVIFNVKPISKTKTDANGKTTTYFTADWSDDKYYYISELGPSDPSSAPSVEIDGFELTVSVDGITEDNGTHVIFEIYKDNGSRPYKTSPKCAVSSSHAEWTCSVTAGGEYKARYRTVKDGKYSEWSGYSGSSGTAPSTPVSITALKALNATSIRIDWTPVSNADTYEVQYTTEKMYFDASSGDEVKKPEPVDAKVAHHQIITGIDKGDEYFFRVRAVNDQGESAWTPIRSIIIGKKPEPPTTWSSTTTAIVGENVSLYWIHNAQDGSSQENAMVTVNINGTSQTYNIPNTDNEDEKDQTRSCVINTQYSTISWTIDGKTTTRSLPATISDGAAIQWFVQTQGVIAEFSEPSVLRSINVYAPPTVELNIVADDPNDNPSYDDDLSIVKRFPFYISALAGPNNQIPIGYHINIVSNELYETVDNIGNPRTINVNESMYSKFFDTSDQLMVEMTAGNIDLQNGISYTLVCTVSMDSGLTGESSVEFTVSWDEEAYYPNAEIAIDEETFSALIKPYCANHTSTLHRVNYHSGVYTVLMDTITGVYGEIVEGAFTETGEQVYYGTSDMGELLYYCTVETSSLIEGVSLSVYRREFDGSFTEIAKNLNNTDSTFVTDPHPSLDYARYRIVATTEGVGSVGYYDVPNYPVNGKAVIIQWDEEWSTFVTNDNEDELATPPWNGSLLKLPYNIDVSDKNAPDVALVEYVGRKRPVSYYGTQLGESATWTTSIPKYDTETLYGLRRLRNWPGDVYVREPSGSGYWANITVSFSQKHLETTIPVTLELVRVEGGM